MGKRSSFERVERDFYPTPYAAVIPLIPHINIGTTFDEPCAGDGALVSHLIDIGLNPAFISDIEPRSGGMVSCDVFDRPFCQGEMFITNPPWDRKILHPLIIHLSRKAPTWLLFDADWMHTKQASDLLKYCRIIVSVGRVKWIPDSKHTGKDNCCWYLFGPGEVVATAFCGR